VWEKSTRRGRMTNFSHAVTLLEKKPCLPIGQKENATRPLQVASYGEQGGK